tara:strand:- start:862 stop:1119 length:258 start_codon:yes stop_codon:yes gene_type:complete
MAKLITAIGFALCFIQCATKATIQKEPDEYVRERHLWETTDIVCDSTVYKYTFIGCMESNKVGWNQDESACKAYAKSQACKPKQR